VRARFVAHVGVVSPRHLLAQGIVGSAMKRLVVDAFSIEPGELELHHELVRLVVDDQPVPAAMTLSDRRLAIVLPERETTWLRRILAVARTRRIVYELWRRNFARLSVQPGRQWTRPSIVFHDEDGSALEVEVADPVLWQTRIERWVQGDHPKAPLPRATLKR
jgi:hypothetical protein